MMKTEFISLSKIVQKSFEANKLGEEIENREKNHLSEEQSSAKKRCLSDYKNIKALK